MNSIPVNTIYLLIREHISAQFETRLKYGLTSNIDFEVLVQNLKMLSTKRKRYNLAVAFLEYDILDTKNVERVDILHLGKNAATNHWDDPTKESIETLVHKFIEKLFNYGKLIKVLKELLLLEIKETFEKMLLKTSEVSESKCNSFMKKFLNLLKRFTSEHFILSFNGSKYDIHLIIDELYKYETITPQCKIKTFRKGSTITSLTLRWMKNTYSQSLIFKDCRNLTDSSCSLQLLSKRFGINEDSEKGTFPHSNNHSVR